jgi:hypothetical protein
MRLIACLAMLMLMVVGAKLARAVEPSLEFGLGGVAHRFTASELLARPDAAEVDKGGPGGVHRRAVRSRRLRGGDDPSRR